ncbi:unnamed protein product [Nippostrongylus brasiliensis]|uniref:Ion_trans_2 domain-containing protein n=1 Tax=Nippostrongylus brasiliensis TaxID=27835 RepID=A0A0N4XIJ6_NIPBR|nr:unnamed protein product [Nippostrongylus brasiliensis]
MKENLQRRSFISVSTIGYGDLVPVPDTWAHTVAIIAFLSVGVVILSTLFDTFRCYLQYVHYLGRPFRGTKDVEVWFGGSVLTVQDLITLVAEQFGVCPQRLRDVIRDLDSILEAACDNTVRNYSESLYRTSEEMQREAVQALRVIHRQLSKSSRRPLLRKEATSIKTRRITL